MQTITVYEKTLNGPRLTMDEHVINNGRVDKLVASYLGAATCPQPKVYTPAWGKEVMSVVCYTHNKVIVTVTTFGGRWTRPEVDAWITDRKRPAWVEKLYAVPA